MGKILDEDLIYEILSVVEEIPEGKVASYGQIARLIGRDKNSRLVGKVLGMAEFSGKYPCHQLQCRELFCIFSKDSCRSSCVCLGDSDRICAM